MNIKIITGSSEGAIKALKWLDKHGYVDYSYHAISKIKSFGKNTTEILFQGMLSEEKAKFLLKAYESGEFEYKVEVVE